MEIIQNSDEIRIGAFKQLKVSLNWSSAIDLDLMTFYRTKDGKTGGVYSENYPGGSFGSLNRFPFIQLSDDEGVGSVKGDNEEVLRIARLDDFESLYIVVINFTDALAGSDKTFADYGAHLEVRTDKGRVYPIALNIGQKGAAALVCKLETGFMGASLFLHNRAMPFEEFQKTIPGASAVQLVQKTARKKENDSMPDHMTDHSGFTPIPSVYIVGNPIKSKDMFVGRNEDFRDIRNVVTGNGSKVILLQGGRRSGKSSMLYQILENDRLEGAGVPVFCDFHHISTQLKNDEDMPLQIAKAILSVERFGKFHDKFFNGDGTWDGTWSGKLGTLVRACLKETAPLPLILLCDEYESIEELLVSGTITTSSLLWAKDMMNLSVYFIMTGSKWFGESLKDIFSHNAQKMEITLLSEEDTRELIVRPVKGFLNYDEKTLKMIYRLSGGYSFFVQYICQALVNILNSGIRRNYTEPDDLRKVTDFIIRNDHGHIQETWNVLSDQAKLTLTVLAHTIAKADKYVKAGSIFKTAGKLRIPLTQQDYNEAVSVLAISAAVKKKKYMIDRKSDGRIRFHIDIFRHWIAHHFQVLEDIELKVKRHFDEKPPEETNGKWKTVVLSGIGILLLAASVYFIPDIIKTFKPVVEFKVDDIVRIKSDIKQPCAGWQGIASSEETGKIIQIITPQQISVDFPSRKSFIACPEDLEVVKK